MKLLNENKQPIPENTGSAEELKTDKWQKLFENYTEGATPEKFLDHCQLMQEDLTHLRFYIEKHFLETVNEMGEARQIRFQNNFQLKQKQSKKLQNNIARLQKKLDDPNPDDERSSSASAQNI